MYREMENKIYILLAPGFPHTYDMSPESHRISEDFLKVGMSLGKLIKQQDLRVGSVCLSALSSRALMGHK